MPKKMKSLQDDDDDFQVAYDAEFTMHANRFGFNLDSACIIAAVVQWYSVADKLRLYTDEDQACNRDVFHFVMSLEEQRLRTTQNIQNLAWENQILGPFIMHLEATKRSQALKILPIQECCALVERKGLNEITMLSLFNGMMRLKGPVIAEALPQEFLEMLMDYSGAKLTLREAINSVWQKRAKDGVPFGITSIIPENVNLMPEPMRSCFYCSAPFSEDSFPTKIRITETGWTKHASC